jgi:hypothetical protein
MVCLVITSGMIPKRMGIKRRRCDSARHRPPIALQMGSFAGGRVFTTFPFKEVSVSDSNTQANTVQLTIFRLSSSLRACSFWSTTMEEEKSPLPSYTDAQKIRLTEWVHKAFFDGWNIKISLSVILSGVLESLQEADEIYERTRLEPPTYPAFRWDGDMDDFLTHLYYAKIPGIVPFDCSQTVKRYVEISFGEDALEFLTSVVKKNDLTTFSHYLSACGFHSKRLKKFTMPLELELLAQAALRHPAYPKPTPAPDRPSLPKPTSPSPSIDPASPQGTLF